MASLGLLSWDKVGQGGKEIWNDRTQGAQLPRWLCNRIWDLSGKHHWGSRDTNALKHGPTEAGLWAVGVDKWCTPGGSHHPHLTSCACYNRDSKSFYLWVEKRCFKIK
jgi:hypothetical protein